MIRHIAGIAEIVADLDAAISHYRDVLGLEVDRQNDDYAIVRIDGVQHFGLWARAAAAERVYGGRQHAEKIPLGYHVEYEVDDVADACVAMAKAGAPITQGRLEEPWGQVSARYVSVGGGLAGLAETPWARTLSRSEKPTA